MGNLGLYQFMTTAAAAVGGPVVFLAGVGIAGYVIGKGIEFIVPIVSDIL